MRCSRSRQPFSLPRTVVERQSQKCRSPYSSSSSLLKEKEEGRTLLDYSATNVVVSRTGAEKCHHCRNDESSNVNNKNSNTRWSAIITGQMIALALTLGNASSSCLANNYQVSIPTVQTGIVYLLLSFHLVYLHYRQNRNDDNCWECGESGLVMDDVREEELCVELLNKTRNVVTCVTAIEYKFPFTSL
jgi:hypothetical protein